MVEGIDRIDWSRPWLAPYREHGLRVAARIEAGVSVARALELERPVQTAPAELTRRPGFVAADRAPANEPYECYIARTGSVPTRDNLHDFFNALVWGRFPVLKCRLNRLQARHIWQHGTGKTRGPLRDTLTIFDENAALLSAPEPLLDALYAREWRRLFIDLRGAWQHASLVLYGHALLEKLVSPRKEITAHVWVMPPGIGAVEDPMAQQPVTKPFAVLPVLGVPRWWPANDEATFYEDGSVFRTRTCSELP